MADATDPLVGQVLDGRYKITQRLSAGGAGVVYRAKHVHLDRSFAIKILTGGLETDEESVKRFEREAQVTSRLRHPNIVEITDFGIDQRMGLYLVMEFVPGVTVRQMVTWNGPLELSSMLEIALQMCAGMAEAHASGIIHRDLKSHNVMVIDNEEDAPVVKVLDFGIAGLADADDSQDRLTRTGILMGTPAYMAPEQTHGRRPDHLADIYAFGCIAYEMLSGSVPLRGRSPFETLELHRQVKPRPFSVTAPDRDIPADIEAVVLRCLEKNKVDRPQSFGMISASLEDAVTATEVDGESSVGQSTLQIDLAKVLAALGDGQEIEDIEPDRFDTSDAGLEALAAMAEEEPPAPPPRVPTSDPMPTPKPAPIVKDPTENPVRLGGSPKPKRRPAPWQQAVMLLAAAAFGGAVVYLLGNWIYT